MFIESIQLCLTDIRSIIIISESTLVIITELYNTVLIIANGIITGGFRCR